MTTLARTTTIKLFFDGASKNNSANGVAGCGYVIYEEYNEKSGEETSEKEEKRIKEEKKRIMVERGYKFIGRGTNNQAEYLGLITGLQRAIDLQIKDLEVYGDSLLVIKQMNNQWKISSENMKKLHGDASALMKNFTAISFAHVARDLNSEADALANMAIAKKNERTPM